MKHTTIAVDLAKSVFEVALSRHPGRVAERQRLSRSRFLPFFTERRPALVLLEACGSAHHWGRQLQALGHRVVLLPPHAVRPYVLRNKTDRSDAKALLEAFRNADLHPVPVKSEAQQALAALHRLRSAWLAARTARINTLRGLLREFGVAIPMGARNVVPRVQAVITEGPEGPVPPTLHPLLSEACAEIHDLEERIRAAETQLARFGKEIRAVRCLRTVPGIGPLTATALVAFIGDVQRFPSGRRFASYLGLTPREHSSGGIRRLGRISKRGDTYLRMLLTHGARAVLWRSKALDHPAPLRAWALRLEQRRGHNKAAIALANKLARIAWAVWRNDAEFKERVAA